MKHQARNKYPDAAELHDQCRPKVPVADLGGGYILAMQHVMDASTELTILRGGAVEYRFHSTLSQCIDDSVLNEATETASRWVRRKLGLPEGVPPAAKVLDLLEQRYAPISELPRGCCLVVRDDGFTDGVRRLALFIKTPSGNFIHHCYCRHQDFDDALIGRAIQSARDMVVAAL